MSNICRRILIVDDNREVRESLVDFLTSCRFEVEGVRNGREALQALAKANARTLVLLDLMMPVMNGWEFQREKSKDPALALHPIVTLTSVNTDLDPEARIDAAGSIRKPVALADLLKVVRRFCESEPPPPGPGPGAEPGSDAGPRSGQEAHA